MIIYDSKGNVVLDIEVDDTSVRYKAIKGENSLTLKFSLDEHIEIPLGAYAVFKNEKYSLMQPEDFVMHHRRNFEYSVVMYSEDAKSKIYKFVNPVDERLKFPLTAKPKEHLQMFVDNMNMRDSGWSVGECPDHVEIVLSYNHTYCYDALVQLADALELDFWFEGKKVNIGKLELNKNNPLPLSYGGDGEGLKPDIKRNNYSDALPIEVLYVQGTGVNINPDKYRVYDRPANELHLPLSYTIGYDGTHFDDEEGFDSSKARYYVTDFFGRAIRRVGKDVVYYSEDSLDCTEIEPTKEETVASVVEVDVEDHFYDILFDSAVDYSKYVIEGEKATIVFQSGMLAGKEFNLATDTNGTLICKKEEDGKWRVEIAPQQLDGITMPDKEKGFIPVGGENGDKFKVFGIQLPDEYVAEAEMNMLKYAVKHFYTNEDVQYTIAGELDEIYAKKNWVNIEGRLNLGNYVSFTDKSFQEEPLLIRIIGIKEYVNKPHSPILELSNSAVTGSLIGSINRMENQEAYTEKIVKDSRQFTKRTFNDAKAAIALLEKAFNDKFSESIKPVTVQTMMMLVGDESLQFMFVSAVGSSSQVAHSEVFDTETKTFKCAAGVLKHMTLGLTEIRSTLNQTYKYWTIPSYESAALTDASAEYYVYAVVQKNGTTGQFKLETEPVGMYDVEDSYYLLLGLLLGENEGSRSYMPLYGFTQILPGQITTDVIRSADGNTYFDLANSVIGGKIVFTSGSSGLTNLSEWSEVEETINSKANQEDLDAFESAVTGEFKNLQKQIDGSITTWFQKGVPTLDNYPAVDWNTGTLKQQHVGDLYYDENTGKAYRFQYNSTSEAYEWTIITDEAIAEALALADLAKDTADGKRRVFTDPPTKDDAYDVGDLWVNATYGTTYSDDLLRCKTAKSEGTAFSIDHWERASKYTDDTAANAAASAAQAALDAANAASGEAKEATGAVTDLVNTTLPALRDGVITESEKIAIEKYINIVNKEFADVTAAYEELSNNSLLPATEKTGLANAYNALTTAKDGLLAAIEGAILEDYTHTSKDVDTAYDTYKEKSASYSTAVEDAYYAIENSIDETAKAAKKATDDLNDDLIFTLTEKRDLRRSLKEINPSEGQHPVVQYYDITKRENLESAYPWTLVNDTSDPYFGWYQTSDSQVDKHSSYSRTKIHLRIYYPCDVRVFIASEAESTYDFVLLSPLDTELLASNLADSNAVATTRGNQSSKVISYTFSFTQAMLDKKKDYFITIKYKKDSSDSSSSIATDKGYYRIDTYPGSLNDYIRICGEKGLPDTTFMSAIEAANELFYFLANDHDLWDDENTELEEIVDAEGEGTGKTNFRNDVYSYFQEYYAAIANLVQVTSMSDLQYLSNAFKDSKGVIDGGLMLGSFIGVGDTVVDDEDNIVVKAAMNGSSLGSDTEHGKLMLALGIPDPDTGSADKEGDFEDRLSEATTRIYEDGTIITDSLDAKGKVESSYAIFRDYIVYKYSKIQDVCNSGTISSDYTLPAKAPTYILFDAQEHNGEDPVLTLPSTYEEGRTITIACTPIISSMDPQLTLSGTMYIAANTTGGHLTSSVNNLVLPGGKVELLRAKNMWIVLTRISE